MSIHRLPADIPHELSTYMDSQSIRAMAQAWRPMHKALHGPHGSTGKYQIELEKYGMVEGVIPHAHRNKSTKELRDMLASYNLALSFLKWNRYDIYRFSQTEKRTTFVDDIHLHHNFGSFMGQSGGWIYHIKTSVVEMIRPPSLRAATETIRIEKGYPFQVVGFAVEPSSGLTAVLQANEQGISRIHIMHPSRTDFSPKVLSSYVRWPIGTVKPAQFEIVGNFVAIMVQQLMPAQNGVQVWKRSSLVVWNWAEGTLKYVKEDVQSFQFISEDTLLILHFGRPRRAPQGENLTLKVCQVQVTRDDPYDISLPDVEVDMLWQTIKAVSFIPRTTPPAKPHPAHDPYFDDWVTGVFDAPLPSKEENGPFHADPEKSVIGIQIDFHPQYHSMSACLLFDLKEFVAPPSLPRAMCCVDGIYPFINGRRVFWWNPAAKNICQRDFNAISLRLYGRGIQNSRHDKDPNYLSSSFPMFGHYPPNANAPFGLNSFEAAAMRRGDWMQMRHFYATEDSVVIMQKSSQDKIGSTYVHVLTFDHCSLFG
ncbi:hypothetical protein BT96DRAFT_1025712 [Gymnopus androsaceus JB14]|uniref:Uncharacterized protein n=1 Tax=Gymnopus androsaceus JB14 TaxID=1447944 RepID=A0A6A4GR20_9AGAR|nr:hypothetical protein BT96DRAFT_1025712 [Gymnopus androsaceus JB14]